jgi:hypothetical protein
MLFYYMDEIQKTDYVGSFADGVGKKKHYVGRLPTASCSQQWCLPIVTHRPKCPKCPKKRQSGNYVQKKNVYRTEKAQKRHRKGTEKAEI